MERSYIEFLMQSGQMGMGINLKSMDVGQAKSILEKLFELDMIKFYLKYHAFYVRIQGRTADCHTKCNFPAGILSHRRQ